MKRYAMRDGERVEYIALNVGDVVTLHEPDGSPISDGGEPGPVRIVGWPSVDCERGIVSIMTESAS